MAVYSFETFSPQNRGYRALYTIFLVSFLEVMTHLLTVIVQETHFFENNQLGIIMYSFVYTVDCIYIMSWIYYLHHRLFRLMRPDDGYRRKFKLLVIPIGIMLVLSFVNMVTPVFFSYDNFVYKRTPLYNLTLLVPIAYIVYGGVVLYLSKAKNRIYRELPIIRLLVPIVIAHVIEWMFIAICVIPLSHVIVLLILLMSKENLRGAEDDLTGLYVRRELLNYLDKVARSTHQMPLIGIMMDVDHFKEINDTFGHVVGDHALKTFAQIITKNMPYNGIGFRYAGDEFVILLENSNLDAAQQLVHRLNEDLQAHMQQAKYEYTFTVSTGTTMWEQNDSVQTFISRLDKAMYQDKMSKVSMLLEEKHTIEPQPVREGINEALLDQMTNFSPDMALFAMDMETGKTIWSDNIVEFFGLANDDEWKSEESIKERVHPDDKELYTESLIRILSGKNTTQFLQYRVLGADGQYRWVQSNGRVRKLGANNRQYFLGSLVYLSETDSFDALTSLLTMDHFLSSAANRIQGGEGNQGRHVIYFDIRNFKIVNIENGLQKGNFVLKQCAQLLQTYFANDLIGRFSGDHFVVLTGKPDLESRIQKIQTEFAAIVNNADLAIKAGIYALQEGDHDIALACDLAQAAVDDIKLSNKMIAVYDEHLEKKLTMERYIVQSIDDAVKNEWLQVYYQPVVRTATGAVCSYEALVRWLDPVYGFMSPADFIPVLEQAGQIDKVDRFVIHEVCKRNHSFAEHDIPMVPVSVNLSQLDIDHTDFANYIVNTAEQYHVPSKMLHIEITESTTISNQKVTQEFMKTLRELGYEIWMDDFGSGYSSLHALTNFEFDEIKLDKGFMDHFGESSKKVIMFVIAMAEHLGLATLAEGVETQEQYDFLKEIGCDKIQGYLISKPLPFDEILKQRMEQPRALELPEKV